MFLNLYLPPPPPPPHKSPKRSPSFPQNPSLSHSTGLLPVTREDSQLGRRDRGPAEIYKIGRRPEGGVEHRKRTN